MVLQHCPKPPSAACFDGVVVSVVAGLGGGGGGASCTRVGVNWQICLLPDWLAA
eukprot:COSAG01_NODE_14533_length_1441_cov_9.633383_2_plen_54_part_01